MDQLSHVFASSVGLCYQHFDDGEIRFHASQVLVDDAVVEDVIDRLIYTTMAMLDQYVPAFLSVIYGNEEPKDAIAYVEAASCRGEQASEGEENGEE